LLFGGWTILDGFWIFLVTHASFIFCDAQSESQHGTIIQQTKVMQINPEKSDAVI